MGSSIAPTVSTLIQGRVQWLAELLAKPRGVALDVSECPKANSTTNHPWYNSQTGKWVIPTGTILAKITATGWFAPIRRTAANGIAASGQPDVVVDDADHCQVGQTWTDGTTSFTIASIDYDTNTLTATGNLSGAIADNAEVYDDTDVPGLEGSNGTTRILLEDCDITSDVDPSISVIQHGKVNESAMPVTVTATMKTQLTEIIEWL